MLKQLLRRFAIFKSMTSPEQPAFILDQEIKLLKDCVRSVVYHLKTDKDSLETGLKRQHAMYDMTGVITWESKDDIKKAENKLWKSVMHMKWLKGDGFFVLGSKSKKERTTNGFEPIIAIRCGSSKNDWRKSVRGKI